jgi:excinuclease UvrABC nuclease subunit
MGRCCSPCLGDLDPNAYRRQLDAALGLFEGGDAGGRLLAAIERQMTEASADRRYERAAALLRRRDRLAWLLERLEGVLRATHTEPRLVVARHPVKERFDAFWIVQGRVVDWGPLPGPGQLAERSQAALARAAEGSRRSPVPPNEVDEVRIVSTWVAANRPQELPLEEAVLAGV